MKSRVCVAWSCVFRVLALGMAVIVGGWQVGAAERVWSGGGSSALWSDPDNWVGGVPNEVDTAVFSGSGGGKTSISVAGSSMAGNLLFAPDAAAYSVGQAGELLNLTGEAAITLAAGSMNNQSIGSKVMVAGTLNIYNYESSKILYLACYTNNGSRTVTIRGSGPVTFGQLQRPPADTESNNNYISLNTYLESEVNFETPVTIGAFWGRDYPVTLNFAPGSINVFCRSDWNFAVNRDVSFNGSGATLRLVQPTVGNRARVAVADNVLSVNVKLDCPAGFETTGGWTKGTIKLNHEDNNIGGTVAIDRGNIVEVEWLALNGAPSPLGSCSTFNFVNPLQDGMGARLRVTGSGASVSDKNFTVEKDWAAIENSGSGTLTLSGGISGNGTIAFDASGGNIVYSGARSGSGGVTKRGAGAVTITSAQGYTGATSIESGVLKLASGATLGSGNLVLAGGSLVLNSGGAASYTVSLPATVLNTPATVSILPAASGATVNFGAITPNGNALMIDAPGVGSGSKIFVSGLAEGAVSWIMLNGKPASYSSSNGLEVVDLPSEPVVDDVIPDAPGKRVEVSSVPVDTLTIAEPVTSLGELAYNAPAAGTLDLGGGILGLSYLTASAPLSVVNGTLTSQEVVPEIAWPGVYTAWSEVLTTDAATGLSPSKSYTHLIDFGHRPVATINGVTFTQGAANGTGDSYGGFPNGNGYSNWNDWTNLIAGVESSGLRDLLYDMNYAGSYTAWIDGLTPGAVYELRLYHRPWDSSTSTQERRCLYKFYGCSESVADTQIIFGAQPNPPSVVVYRYIAPASGKISYYCDAVAIGGNVHNGIYAFSNEELAPASKTPEADSLVMSGPLVVDAALKDGGMPLSLVTTGEDTVTLQGSVGLTGSVLFDAVTLLAPASDAIQAFNGAVASYKPLVIDGAGRVVFSSANPGLNSSITVRSGVLEVHDSDALGVDLDQEVTVEPGGALAVGMALNESLQIKKVVTIAGSGPDGRGALIFDHNNRQYNAFRSLTLSGDATIGGGCGTALIPSDANHNRFDVRGGVLDFNNHKLTKKGNNEFIATSVTVNGVGANAGIDIEEGTFGVEGSTDLGGSSVNTINIATGAAFDLYNLAPQIGWKVAAEDGASITVRAGGSSHNVISGPVVLESGSVVVNSRSSGLYNTISGQISGSGGLVKNGNSITILGNPDNTYGGGTVVNAGTLRADYPGSLPGAPGSVSVNGSGELRVRYGGGYWSAGDLNTLALGNSFKAVSTVMGIDARDGDVSYSGALSAALLRKSGPYRLTLNGSWSNHEGLRVDEGVLAFAEEGEYYGFDTGSRKARASIELGTVSGGRGVLEVADDAVVQGRILMGNNASGAGAIYQSGGTFINTGGWAHDARISVNGFGHYEISGGLLINKGYTQVSLNKDSTGTLRIKGDGVVRYNSGSNAPEGSGGNDRDAYYEGVLGMRGGHGHIYLSGSGALNTGTTGINLGEWSDVNSYLDGTANMTLDESATVNARNIVMANRNGSPTSSLTLLGGMLCTEYIQKGGNNAAESSGSATINFDGGVIKPTMSGRVVRTGANNTPMQLSVHKGGAVFEIDEGVATALDHPLQMAGRGVAAIEVKSAGAGYIAPPFVHVSGGGGFGAVAVAEISDGQVTGIRIISSGSGYSTLPEVTLSGGGFTTAAVVGQVALGLPAAVDGGLRKQGEGTLALNSVNSYLGPTAISGGLLVQGVAGAIPDGSELVLEGGTLALGGNSHNSRSVSASGGTLAGGSVTAGSFVKEGDGVLNLSAPLTMVDTTAAKVEAAKIPGLREYRLAGSSNLGGPEEAVFGPSVQLTTRALNGNVGSGGSINDAYWPDNSTYLYTGYIWNSGSENVTWTFMENMDDRILVRIDGTIVLNKGYSDYLPYWNTGNYGAYCTVTLTPGPHKIEIRASQGGGSVGGYWTRSDGARPALGVDRQGRSEANVEWLEILSDPGDGSLFTVNNPYEDCGVEFETVSTAVPDLPSDVLDGVGELAEGYSVVYAGSVPTQSDSIVDNSFWSINNALTNSNDFDRVAYVLRLGKSGATPQWVWVSYDPVIKDRTKIGFPISANRMMWQRRVGNLTVRSNVAAVTEVTDSDTGNIEFYPGDYNHALPSRERGYEGDGTKYDFDDRCNSNRGNYFGIADGYGSFQIHNFGLGETLFAINHWGSNGRTLCLGIGNKPNDNTNLDWTFTTNAGEYNVRELYILTRDMAPIVEEEPEVEILEGTLRAVAGTGGMLPAPDDVIAKVGDLANGYDMLYYSPISTTAAEAYNGTAYVVDNSGKSESFDRVAYFMEIRKRGESATEWVWVSFDAHTQDRSKLGYPNRNGATFIWQQKVYNMDVRSNVDRVTNVTGVDTGNLEIWPSNYGAGIGLPDIGGSSSAFDFNDSGANGTTHGHGSFQIHNWGAEEVLFSISHCGNQGNTLGVGIGNDPNPPSNMQTAYDYTWTYNAGDYDIRTLYVFVRPTVSSEAQGQVLADAPVYLGEGGVLDLNGATQKVKSLRGSGTIASGKLADGSEYRVEIRGEVSSCITLSSVDIGNWRVVPADAESSQPTAGSYVIATGSFSGKPSLDGFPSRYKLIASHGELKLTKEGGTLMLLR